MKTMQNFSPNWARPSRQSMAIACCCALIQPTFAIAASPVTVCKKTPAARQDALLMVDSAHRLIAGKTLHVGDVDFSTSREVTRKFLVVAPLRAHPMTSLGGIEMRSDLELVWKCPDKNLFALNISFDGSNLPAGAFSVPLSVYQDGFGMKGAPLSASVEGVSGTIKRSWIAAELSKKVPVDRIDLRLTNSGNLKSDPLRFPPLVGAKSVQVGTNECEARVLAPSESCVIELTVSPQSSMDEVFEWPVDGGEQALLTLQFERRRDAALDVSARNW